MGHALNKKSQEDCFPAVLRQSKAALNSTNMKSTVGCLVLKHVLNTLHATVSTGTPHTSGIYKSRVNNEWQFKDEGLGAMFYCRKRPMERILSQGRTWIIKQKRTKSISAKASEIDAEFPNEDPKWRRYVGEY